MLPGEDREPRHAHEAAITLRAGSTVIHGRSRDVSRGGMCASVPAALAIGTDVLVDLQLVFAAGAPGDPIRLPARVVWCTRLDDAFQVGVAFRRLDQTQQETLATLVRCLGDQDDDSEPAPHERAVDDRFG